MNKWISGQPSPWRKSSKRESCYGDRVYHRYHLHCPMHRSLQQRSTKKRAGGLVVIDRPNLPTQPASAASEGPPAAAEVRGQRWACYIISCYSISYYVILYYTTLHYTILFYTILYCTILYYTVSS